MGKSGKADQLRALLEESVAVKQSLLSSGDILATLVSAAERIEEGLRQGKKVIFFGNGGSASDSLHLAAEFVGRFGSEPRAGLPALALPANTSVVTAIANDFGYEEIFSRQIEALGDWGDIALGLSTSGRSANVLKGVQKAKEKGLFTIGFTGRSGGDLCKLTDLCVCAPSEETQRIQEVHITLGHALCALVEDGLLKR